MPRAKPTEDEEDFGAAVERALKLELKGIAALEPADRHKLLAVATRWAAIKARLVSPGDAAGFEDLDLDKG